MQALKSLHAPEINENVLRSLSKNQLTTVIDFLDEDASKLSHMTKLNLSQVIDIKNQIYNKYSAPLKQGLHLLNKHSNNFIPTGIEGLDTLLKGGIPTGYITELCGLADSGKTQLCYQLAINCVKNTENNVLYVDTKGDFSAIRIQSMLEACECSHKEMAEIMFKIKVVHIWTIEDLVELFKTLENKTTIINNLALIIIDSLPCLMFQFLGEDNKIGLSYLNKFVNHCRFVCKNFNLGIVCVNIQTRWVDKNVVDIDDDADFISKEPSYVETRNRCLGRYWQHIPALVLQVDKVQDNNYNETNNCYILNAILIKSNFLSNLSQQQTLHLSRLGVT